MIGRRSHRCDEAIGVTKPSVWNAINRHRSFAFLGHEVRAHLTTPVLPTNLFLYSPGRVQTSGVLATADPPSSRRPHRLWQAALCLFCGGVLGLGHSDPGHLGKGFSAHGATLFHPLLGLADEHRANEADDGSSVRKDAHHVRTSADLLVEALLPTQTQQCRASGTIRFLICPRRAAISASACCCATCAPKHSSHRRS